MDSEDTLHAPILAEALSAWLTNMAQRGVPPDIIDSRMVMVWRVLEYIEGIRQLNSRRTVHMEINDLIYAHYGYYENFIFDHGLEAAEIRTLYESVNNFLEFVANEYKLPAILLKRVKEHTGKSSRAITQRHLDLISVLRNMERKLKRHALGVLLERHRELSEVDDLIRRIMG